MMADTIIFPRVFYIILISVIFSTFFDNGAAGQMVINCEAKPINCYGGELRECSSEYYCCDGLGDGARFACRAGRVWNNSTKQCDLVETVEVCLISSTTPPLTTVPPSTPFVGSVATSLSTSTPSSTSTSTPAVESSTSVPVSSPIAAVTPIETTLGSTTVVSTEAATPSTTSPIASFTTAALPPIVISTTTIATTSEAAEPSTSTSTTPTSASTATSSTTTVTTTAVTSTTTAPKPSSTRAPANIDCYTKDDGDYADEINPCNNRYYTCVGGTAIPRLCPGTLYFDPYTDACMLARYVVACGGKLLTTTTPSANASTIASVPMPSLPPAYRFNCTLKRDGDYGDPFQKCSPYIYSCVAGSPFVKTCSVGTFYDSELGKCDYSKYVTACGGAAHTTETSNITSTTTPATTTKVFLPFFDCIGKDLGEYVDPVNNCSRQYYVCEGAVDGVRMTCADGTYYDTVLQSCTYKEYIVSCGGTPLSTAEPSNVTAAALVPTLEFNCTGLDAGNYPDNNSSCSNRYFTCTSAGVAYERRCPRPVLMYDSEWDQCLSSSEVPSCSGVPRTTTVWTNSTNGQILRAREVDSADALIDCHTLPSGNYAPLNVTCPTYFYQCSNQRTFMVPCPGNERYRADLDVCTAPADVPSCFENFTTWDTSPTSTWSTAFSATPAPEVSPVAFFNHTTMEIDQNATTSEPIIFIDEVTTFDLHSSPTSSVATEFWNATAATELPESSTANVTAASPEPLANRASEDLWNSTTPLVATTEISTVETLSFENTTVSSAASSDHNSTSQGTLGPVTDILNSTLADISTVAFSATVTAESSTVSSPVISQPAGEHSTTSASPESFSSSTTATPVPVILENGTAAISTFSTEMSSSPSMVITTDIGPTTSFQTTTSSSNVTRPANVVHSTTAEGTTVSHTTSTNAPVSTTETLSSVKTIFNATTEFVRLLDNQTEAALSTISAQPSNANPWIFEDDLGRMNF